MKILYHIRKSDHISRFIDLVLYYYLEFKLRYLKILKLFSIRVKELFEPIIIVLAKKKKKKAMGLALFKSIFFK